MKLNNQDLMSEFHERVKDEFDLDYEQTKDICFGPWRFLKEQVESGKLTTVRLKYFGKFTVYPGRARNMLIDIKAKSEAGRTTHAYYLKYKTMIETYLNKLEELGKQKGL